MYDIQINPRSSEEPKSNTKRIYFWFFLPHQTTHTSDIRQQDHCMSKRRSQTTTTNWVSHPSFIKKKLERRGVLKKSRNKTRTTRFLTQNQKQEQYSMCERSLRRNMPHFKHSILSSMPAQTKTPLSKPPKSTTY